MQQEEKGANCTLEDGGRVAEDGKKGCGEEICLLIFFFSGCLKNLYVSRSFFTNLKTREEFYWTLILVWPQHLISVIPEIESSGVMGPATQSPRINITTCVHHCLEKRHAFEGTATFYFHTERNWIQFSLGMGNMVGGVEKLILGGR